jgi:protein-tyrosine phosphatase
VHPEPSRVLVVCVGNQCRSPLAERLLRQRVGPDAAVVVTSAGTLGPPGLPMEQHAAAELVRLGGDPTGFRSARLDDRTLGDQDLVLTATKAIRTEVLQRAPRLMRRTFTLRELAQIVAARGPGGLPLRELVAAAAAHRTSASRDVDLDDPMGRSAEVHRRVADEIAADVATIATALSG